MDSLDELAQYVEDAFLARMIYLLENYYTNVELAKTAAKAFLALSPFISLKDIHDKLKSFTDSNDEYMPVYIDFMAKVDKTIMPPVADKIEHYIQSGQIDEALKVVPPNPNG